MEEVSTERWSQGPGGVSAVGCYCSFWVEVAGGELGARHARVSVKIQADDKAEVNNVEGWTWSLRKAKLGAIWCSLE